MPTWVMGSADGYVERKYTRSPGRRSAVSTRAVASYCICAVRGRPTPIWPKDHWTRPLQSKPELGLAPPQAYGIPRYRLATATTSGVGAPGAGGATPAPRAPTVAGAGGPAPAPAAGSAAPPARAAADAGTTDSRK